MRKSSASISSETVHELKQKFQQPESSKANQACNKKQIHEAESDDRKKPPGKLAATKMKSGVG